MLRLVHPASQGKDPRPPKGCRSPALFPTPEESDRLRAALRNLRRAYGTWSCLAEVMGVPVKTLMGVIGRRTPGSYGIAIRAARAGGIPVEQILSPGVAVAGRCALCGRKGAP